MASSVWKHGPFSGSYPWRKLKNDREFGKNIWNQGTKSMKHMEQPRETIGHCIQFGWEKVRKGQVNQAMRLSRWINTWLVIQRFRIIRSGGLIILNHTQLLESRQQKRLGIEVGTVGTMELGIAQTRISELVCCWSHTSMVFCGLIIRMKSPKIQSIPWSRSPYGPIQWLAGPCFAASAAIRPPSWNAQKVRNTFLWRNGMRKASSSTRRSEKPLD